MCNKFQQLAQVKNWFVFFLAYSQLLPVRLISTYTSMFMCFSNPTHLTFIAPNWTAISHREDGCPTASRCRFGGLENVLTNEHVYTWEQFWQQRWPGEAWQFCTGGSGVAEGTHAHILQGSAGFQSHAGDSAYKHAPPPLPSLPRCALCAGVFASHLSAQPSLMFLFPAVNVTWWYFPQAALYSLTFSRGLRLIFHVFSYLLHVRQAFSSPFTQPCAYILAGYVRMPFPPLYFFLLSIQHFGGLCLFTLIQAKQEFTALCAIFWPLALTVLGIYGNTQ